MISSLIQAWIATLVTHACNFIKGTRRVYPWNFNRDLTPFVVTLPHITKPATIQWGTRPVIAEWDLHGSWKQSLVTTYFTQSIQTLLSKLWC